MKDIKSIFAALVLIFSFAACKDKPAEEVVTSVTLSANRSMVSVGETVVFTVKSNLGTKQISGLTIYVNNVAISGLTYSPSAEGSFTIFAKYQNIQSNTLKLEVLSPSPYVQKALIEDYTGTWCGYCPRVIEAIELTLAQSQNVIPVAIHSSNGSSIDPFNFNLKNELLDSFDFNGYPTARINRVETWSYPENTPEGVHQVVSKLSSSASLGIGISSTLSGGILNIATEIGFHFDQSNLKLVVYLVEDKLIADQANYYEDLFGGASTLVNFEHNHVLRHSLTDLFGDAIPDGESTKDNIFKQSFSFTVADSEISNSANVSVVAFVVKGSTGKVINIQKAAVNKTVAF